MTRLCACGCKASLEGKRKGARYASPACRTRGWKREHGITGIRYVRASQNGSQRRSGLQVSYRKAVDAVARCLVLISPVAPGRADEEAEAVLRPALSPRQRELLERREREAA